MAENKQYVTQVQENGTVMISEDVIAAIVAHTAGEVEGVVGMAGKPAAEIIGKKALSKGLKITVADDESLAVECNVNIRYGQSVVAVAKAVQEAVRNALESMAGVVVTSVNVNVSGIVRS